MSCMYLPQRDAAFETRRLATASLDDVDSLLEHGWRRSGDSYLRQICSACHECVSLRIPVAHFIATRSQTRALRKCADLALRVGVPRVDDVRLGVYRAWLKMQASKRGWEEGDATTSDYVEQFCAPHQTVREMAFYEGRAPGGHRHRGRDAQIIQQRGFLLSPR